MSKYRKFYASATGLITLIVGTELGVGSKWYTYAVAAVASGAVWFFPNDPANA